VNVAVVGSGSFGNYGLMKAALLRLMDSSRVSCIYSDVAKGIRSLAEQFAAEYQIPMDVASAENSVQKSDAVVVLFNGRSHAGSAAIALAERAGKAVYVVPAD
jgi:predicted dehydrogenase